jgi:hypothetical protein
MAALMNALRAGANVKDTILYCTTFPCHECARHLVGAGIRRVVYVEPYPKSRVTELHSDSIVLGQRSDPNPQKDPRVEFLPFIGIAPHRQTDLYSWVVRRVRDARGIGHSVSWSLEDEPPVRATIEPENPERRIVQYSAIRLMEDAIVAVLDTHVGGTDP